MKTPTFKYARLFIASILICFATSQSFASGTVVGNGGDPIFEFMRATKESMIETIKFILNEETERNSFCKLNHLTESQIHFCRDFFSSISSDILRLSQGDKQTPFVLRDSPLYVTGPDGKAMIVSARTDLGPDGPIEIHRDSVKMLPPTQVLFLITHEFEHKTMFNGRSVTDNEQIGPFASGRDLLDAVASAVVSVAKRKGKVGTQFGIRDIFQCTAIADTVQFGAQIVSSRLFQAEDLMSYETSVGKNPLDGSIYFQENINTHLRLRFTISEPNNCGEVTPHRGTIVQVVRSTTQNGSTTENVLASKTLATNPMCPQENPNLDIEYKNIQFACKYYGSEGTTASPFSLSRN